jgi:uncharacterized protein with NAD-binding domain and iron-sulfur cluster
MKALLLTISFICVLTARAELDVTVLPLKITGQKAVVPLVMQNHFAQKIESARASVFLLDEKGKMVGQSTKWVIGGTPNMDLAPGATNTFNFVFTVEKPITATNLTAKAVFNRVLLEGGKLTDATKDVVISNAK